MLTNHPIWHGLVTIFVKNTHAICQGQATLSGNGKPQSHAHWERKLSISYPHLIPTFCNFSISPPLFFFSLSLSLSLSTHSQPPKVVSLHWRQILKAIQRSRHSHPPHLSPPFPLPSLAKWLLGVTVTFHRSKSAAVRVPDHITRVTTGTNTGNLGVRRENVQCGKEKWTLPGSSTLITLSA